MSPSNICSHLERETVHGFSLMSFCNGRDQAIRTLESSRCGELFRECVSPGLSTLRLNGPSRYLQNGSILAAKAFIKQFAKGLPVSILSSATSVPVGDNDEVIMTSESLVNFSQLAVVTCQRAQGDKSKVPRESWVRLCGTYQSKGGPLAFPEVRGVRLLWHTSFHI
jgi:hypothetical protein